MEMTVLRAVEVTPAEAAELIHHELLQAAQALEAANLDATLDGYVRALGLGLQVGPAAAEQVLVAVLQASRQLALRQDAAGCHRCPPVDAPTVLSALGPEVVQLAKDVREAGALPDTPVMAAWATLACEVGTLIGQLGLALSIPPSQRAGMLDNARTRAALLDDATDNCFALTTWLDEITSATNQ
jgi:hypothetical protein